VFHTEKRRKEETGEAEEEGEEDESTIAKNWLY
jgi:hypothetical protein